MRKLIGIALAVFSTQAFPASWTCRNNDLEIRCEAGRCAASEGFTPVDIRIDTQGPLTVCAYSGCWEGPGRFLQRGRHILASGTALKWTGAGGGAEDFMLAVDTRDQVGFVKGGGFAMPLACTRQAG